MYWPPDELAAVERILAGSGGQQRLGEVSLEFDSHGPPGAEPELRPQLWSPDGGPTPRQHLVGTAHHHGVPVRLGAS
jgi:hypothetical protein